MAKLPHEDTELLNSFNNPVDMNDLESDAAYLAELAQDKRRRLQKTLTLLGIILVLLALLCAALWYMRSGDTPVEPITNTATPAENTAQTPIQQPVPTEMPVVAPETVEPISTPIPQDGALAGEELDRLTDENKRTEALIKQLETQITQSKQLAELKGKQLEELQQQTKSLEPTTP